MEINFIISLLKVIFIKKKLIKKLFMKKKIKKNINICNLCIVKVYFISKLYLFGKKLIEIVFCRILIKVILFNEIFFFFLI